MTDKQSPQPISSQNSLASNLITNQVKERYKKELQVLMVCETMAVLFYFIIIFFYSMCFDLPLQFAIRLEYWVIALCSVWLLSLFLFQDITWICVHFIPNFIKSLPVRRVSFLFGLETWRLSDNGIQLSLSPFWYLFTSVLYSNDFLLNGPDVVVLCLTLGCTDFKDRVLVKKWKEKKR